MHCSTTTHHKTKQFDVAEARAMTLNESGKLIINHVAKDKLVRRFDLGGLVSHKTVTAVFCD